MLEIGESDGIKIGENARYRILLCMGGFSLTRIALGV